MMTLSVTAMMQRFRGDCRGLAALEFALIVPLMLTILFGTIEITNGVAANRKVDLVARTLSDLTSRTRSVDPTDITSFFTVGEAILQPYDKTPMAATISQVYIDPATQNGLVQWSQATSGTTARKKNDPVMVPGGLISKDPLSGKVIPDQYLILSEVIYPYKPAVGYVMSIAGVTLSASTFTRPRQQSCVYYPTVCTPP